MRVKEGFCINGVDREVTTRISYNWKFNWIYIDETKDEETKCTI